MPERIIEEHVHTDGGGGNALTALVAVLILIIVVFAALYLFRVIGRSHKTEIDVNIKKPGVVLLLGS